MLTLQGADLQVSTDDLDGMEVLCQVGSQYYLKASQALEAFRADRAEKEKAAAEAAWADTQNELLKLQQEEKAAKEEAVRLAAETASRERRIADLQAKALQVQGMLSQGSGESPRMGIRARAWGLPSPRTEVGARGWVSESMDGSSPGLLIKALACAGSSTIATTPNVPSKNDAGPSLVGGRGGESEVRTQA